MSTTQPHATADAALRHARERIDPDDAALLLAHVLGRSRSWLYAHGDEALSTDDSRRFDGCVERRADGEPVAYLIGRRGFWTLDLTVTKDTLIPRADTERLVERALQCIPVDAAWRIADLGTGSGAIALALARERPRSQVIATDRSRAALAVARGNATALELDNVTFRHGDWLQALDGERVDLIASNPPYIAQDDAHLAQGDLRFEPIDALASGVDGLDAIRTIAAAAGAHLRPGGWLLLEHGWNQGDAVRALLSAAGFAEVATGTDIEGRDRVSLGRWGDVLATA